LSGMKKRTLPNAALGRLTPVHLYTLEPKTAVIKQARTSKRCSPGADILLGIILKAQKLSSQFTLISTLSDQRACK